MFGLFCLNCLLSQKGKLSQLEKESRTHALSFLSPFFFSFLPPLPSLFLPFPSLCLSPSPFPFTFLSPSLSFVTPLFLPPKMDQGVRRSVPGGNDEYEEMLAAYEQGKLQATAAKVSRRPPPSLGTPSASQKTEVQQQEEHAQGQPKHQEAVPGNMSEKVFEDPAVEPLQRSVRERATAKQSNSATQALGQQLQGMAIQQQALQRLSVSKTRIKPTRGKSLFAAQFDATFGSQQRKRAPSPKQAPPQRIHASFAPAQPSAPFAPRQNPSIEPQPRVNVEGRSHKQTIMACHWPCTCLQTHSIPLRLTFRFLCSW